MESRKLPIASHEHEVIDSNVTIAPGFEKASAEDIRCSAKRNLRIPMKLRLKPTRYVQAQPTARKNWSV